MHSYQVIPAEVPAAICNVTNVLVLLFSSEQDGGGANQIASIAVTERKGSSLLDGDVEFVVGATMVCSIQTRFWWWYSQTCIIPLEKPDTNAVLGVMWVAEHGASFAVTTQVITMGDIDTDGGDFSRVVHRSVFCT